MRISDWSSDVCSSDLRLEAGRREVGAAVIAEIGERHDTDVDPVAERLEDAGGGRTDTIAAGLVNHGSGAERPGDGLRQRRQFRVLELRRQVAWIGVGRIDDLLKRRVHPRMEVRAVSTGRSEERRVGKEGVSTG